MAAPRVGGSHAALVLVVLAGYLLTLSTAYYGLISDGQDMLFTAASIHEFGELAIGPQMDVETAKVVRPDKYSKYGLGFPLVLQIPLTIAAFLEKHGGAGSGNAAFPLTNMALTAATALLVALSLAQLQCSRRAQIIGGFTYAFGTFAWPYASYDFSEPLQALCIAAAFWLLLRARTAHTVGDLVAAGTILGFGVLTKTSLAVLVPGYALYALTSPTGGARRLRRVVAFTLPLAAWACLIAFLNFQRFGSAFESGYRGEAGQFTTPLLTGLYGLMLSPNKGLLFYAPAALLPVPLALFKLRHERARTTFFALTLIVYVTLIAKWWSWEGGASWGPRLLLPILPIAMICAATVMDRSVGATRAFVGLAAAGIAVNALGVAVFFLAWTNVVGSGTERVPIDVRGRPSSEYVERNGQKLFYPFIATFYVPSLSPIRGHAWLLGLRYLAGRTRCARAAPELRWRWDRSPSNSTISTRALHRSSVQGTSTWPIFSPARPRNGDTPSRDMLPCSTCRRSVPRLRDGGIGPLDSTTGSRNSCPMTPPRRSTTGYPSIAAARRGRLNGVSLRSRVCIPTMSPRVSRSRSSTTDIP